MYRFSKSNFFFFSFFFSTFFFSAFAFKSNSIIKEKNPPSLSVNCDPNGFTGNYQTGIAMTTTNKFLVTITNNSFCDTNLTFSTNDLNLTGISDLTVTSVSPSSVVLYWENSVTVEYTLSGTPASAGTLTGTWSHSGLTCIDTQILSSSISTLNCVSASHTGTLLANVTASGISSNITYTGGTGGTYSVYSASSTGVTGLTATIAAGTFNNGSGTLTVNISGTPTSSGTANFVINIGGKTCTLTRTVNAGTPICNVSGASLKLSGFGTFSFGIGSVTATALNGSYSSSYTQTACSVSISTGPFYSSSTSDGDTRLTFTNPFTGKVRIIANAMGGEDLCFLNETSGVNIIPTISNSCRSAISGSCVRTSHLSVADATGQPGSGHATLLYNVSSATSILLEFSNFIGVHTNGTVYSIELICN